MSWRESAAENVFRSRSRITCKNLAYKPLLTYPQVSLLATITGKPSFAGHAAETEPVMLDQAWHFRSFMLLDIDREMACKE